MYNLHIIHAALRLSEGPGKVGHCVICNILKTMLMELLRKLWYAERVYFMKKRITFNQFAIEYLVTVYVHLKDRNACHAFNIGFPLL